MNKTYKEILKCVLLNIKQKGFCTRKDILIGCGLDNSNLSKTLNNIYLIEKEKQ